MTPVEVPLSLIPKRRPRPAAALAVTVLSLLAALAIRFLFLGMSINQGLTSTVFPALMLTTMFGGARWGLFGLALIGGFIGWMIERNTGGRLDAAQWSGLVLFLISALATVGVAGAFREVVLRLDETRRARDSAEAYRRESEERFRILADSAAAPMWVTRTDHTREFVNRAYAEFLGKPAEQALVFDWRDRIHKDDIARILQEQVEGEGSLQPFTLEARYLRADGQWRWLRSVSRPRLGPNGEFEGFIGIAFDVTDAKQVEADLTRINDLLAEKVEAALAERNVAQAALVQSQKLEALGQLTGGVAHDFNNLLTVVIGALDIILRHPDDGARRERLGKAALSAAKRGERLTQQLLAFSRRQPLSPEVFAVDALLQESELLLRRAVGEGFNLAFDLAAGRTRARIDAGQFEASVLNLLINARDATEDGGKIVVATRVVSLPNPPGELTAGRYFKVSVTDDGAGMDADVAARAFEPFFTTKPVGKGTGLGLSQVYGFARQSGGFMQIDSRPGEGCAVHLFLPVTSEAVASQPAAPAPAITAPLKVLLVEDDADVGDLIEAMLGELGHAVLRAENVDQGLNLVEAHPDIGLMISDVIMPGGRTGVDLARQASVLRPSLPIVLSSGYTGASLAEAAPLPWPLLRKPYTLDGLRQAIVDATPSPHTIA